MCHLDAAQCRILKDSGRFLVKIPRGLGLKKRESFAPGQLRCPHKIIRLVSKSEI